MKNNFAWMCIFFAALFAGVSSSVARADIIILKPTKDNSMYAENNRSNALGGLFVGRTLGSGGTTIRRALLQFDPSSIPAGSTINSVTLRLERVIAGPSAGEDVLSLHRALASWGEGTSFGVGKGATPTANDATWNFRFYNTTSWTNPGGDFAGSSGTVTLDNLNNQYTFASQPGMVADVQNWINDPSSNYGWLLKYVDENAIGTARYFASRESSIDQQPTLTIDFTAVPEPNSCLLLGAAGIVAAAYRRGRLRV